MTAESSRRLLLLVLGALLLILAFIPGATTAPAPLPFVWWEAEAPQATSFPPAEQNPFKPADAEQAAVLSAGQWIGAEGERAEPLFLEYEVTVPREGTYQLYARKFWRHGPFRWRIDAGPWQEVPASAALLDEAPIRQFVVANWVHAGSAEMGRGKHVVRIELTENRGAAAFDAFLLTTQPFVARGRLKPGEKYGRAPAGWFPFEPDPDPFAPSPIDLRSLNEKMAGDGGFIRARGEQLVHGKTGKPVRFWAVNAGPDLVNLDPISLDFLARHLAKLGVNMVRIHGPVWGRDFRQVDRAYLDRLFRFVAAMKREGIYTGLSIYFPLWLQFGPESGFAGYTGKHPFALLFFHPEFQAIYRGWWKALLTTPNPHTGRPLNAEPAVAIAELVNEDSYLFWTFQPYEAVPAEQMALLERQFGDWLKGKYGSLERAFAAWGGKPVRGDNAAAGRAGFMPLYEVFNTRDRRAQDTATFLTVSQQRFFERSTEYLKEELGFRGAVVASNWITASASILGPLDKYSNTVADAMDRHGYFDPLHEGERASYSLSRGDRYDDRSALLFQPRKAGETPDFSLPIMDIGYNGKPSLISEVNWPMPNRFRADLPLLAAAYGALQGTDGTFLFALSGPTWQQVPSKFSIQTPVIMGQSPAAALIFRKGLVKPGAPVVEVSLKPTELFALKGAPVVAPVNLEELRARDIPAGQTAEVARLERIDPLAHLVGKVSVRFAEKDGKSRVADLSRFIDRGARTVRSQTGELLWDYGAGRVTVNAPAAQGVTGFLQKAGAVSLRDVTIRGGMEYGTVLLVALDGRPLRESGKMLLQVMSEDSNYGWEAPGSGPREIKSTGAAPIVVKKMSGTVSLPRKDADRLRVTALDFNGYRKKPLGSARSIALQEATLYYLIER